MHLLSFLLPAAEPEIPSYLPRTDLPLKIGLPCIGVCV